MDYLGLTVKRNWMTGRNSLWMNGARGVAWRTTDAALQSNLLSEAENFKLLEGIIRELKRKSFIFQNPPGRKSSYWKKILWLSPGDTGGKLINMQQFPTEKPPPTTAPPSLLSPRNNLILSLFPRFHWGEYGQCGIDWLSHTRNIDFLSFTIENKQQQQNTNTPNAGFIWQLTVRVAEQVDELRNSHYY